MAVVHKYFQKSVSNLKILDHRRATWPVNLTIIWHIFLGAREVTYVPVCNLSAYVMLLAYEGDHTP
jgi:hypothetical protein